MLKIETIQILETYKLLCVFNTGEKRILDIQSTLDLANEYVKRIVQPETFKKVKIGDFGQIYWENIAEMKDLNGVTFPCEFDMSPEFVYHNSASC